MKIKVAAVNYLNTKPLLYGIKNSAIFNEIDLVETYPARVAQWVLDGAVDVGLVPVAIIPKLSASHIITGYCIGCDGAVASVCIFSDVPIDEVQNVYLDYQSRTSVELAKILLKEHWKSDATLIAATGDDFINDIKGTSAGLVIGDRAFRQRLQFKYIYDLGEAWKQHTGLPFVFAAWVSNKQLPPAFIEAFDKANETGLLQMEMVIKQNQTPLYDIEKYYTQNISYLFNAEKKQGMKKFLEKLNY